MYKVYVKTDTEGRIVDINSDAFIDNTDGWTQIDQQDSDRCHHAQNNYFPLPVTTDDGSYRYKLEDGVAVERTAMEISEDLVHIPPQEDPTAIINGLIAEMARQNTILAGLIEEMSNIVRS